MSYYTFLECLADENAMEYKDGRNIPGDNTAKKAAAGENKCGQEVSAKDLLLLVRKQLSDAGIDEAAYESWLLLEWICKIDKETYFTNQNVMISGEKVSELEAVLAKRKERVPLQYLMGTCEFMGYTFHVDERVLIPRQDTECLVEQALAVMQKEAKRKPSGWKPAVLDLCTGSGCIGLSIQKMYPEVSVSLSDISDGALEVARFNAAKLDVRACFVQSDLFEDIKGRYDFIVSNPPYIPTKTIATLMPEVRDHEPRLALDGAGDGLEFYRRIVREAKTHLVPGGFLMLEIGMEQGGELKRLFAEEGYSNVEIKKDLAGLDRMAFGRHEA